MNARNDSSSAPVAFISDAHLRNCGPDRAREERLVSFLRRISGRVSHLYIVGDLFDFWFEYWTVVPITAPRVVFELYNLVQHGTKVTLFAGNHDYWAGKYLAREVGLDLEPGGRTVEHQGVTMFIHHGDGFYPGDRGYRLLKRVLRSRIAIALFRLLHPDAAAWVARITSRTSRKHLAKPDFDRRNIEAFRAVADRLFADGYGAVVFGHAHVPLVERRPGGTLVVPGDWIAHNTYVLLENGTFTLHSWPNE